MSLNGNEEQSSTTSSSFAGKKRKNLVELTPSFTNNNSSSNNNTIVVLAAAGSDSQGKENSEHHYQEAGQELGSAVGAAGDMPPSKRQRSTISETSNENMNESFDEKQPNVEARFLIATKTAGAVIGRAGCNITNLRQTFNATISVPDSAGAPERVMTIVASIDKVSKIVRQILKFIEVQRPQSSGQKGASGHGNNVNTANNDEKSDKVAPAEIRMLLHISHAGALIGKRGSRITQLREETQAGLRVFSDCLPQSTERVCAITGQIDIVAGAVKSILEIVSAFPIKGESIPYECRNFDPYTAGTYGGFSDISDMDTGRGSAMGSLRSGIGSQAGGPGGMGGGFRTGAGNGRFGQQDGGFSKRNGHSTGGGAGGMRDFSSGAYYPENGVYGNGGRLAGNGFGSVGVGNPQTAGGGNSWSSARSFNSSRRNSNIGNGGAAAAAAAGLDAQMAQFGSAAAAAAAAGASPMDVGWFGGYNAATAATGNGGDCKTMWNNQYNFMYASMGGSAGGNEHVMKNANVEYVALPDGSFQTDLRVPSRIVGGIIGKNGARINDIRQKSRANIAIDRSRSPNRVITVKGSMNEVQAACALICKSIEENQ